MVCSFGDQNDVAIFRELALTPFQAIDLDGRMTEVAGPYAGLKVAEAREKVIEDLEAAGRIVAMVEKDQEVPVSERGKNPVEIILLTEWYVRQTHIQGRMKELIEDIEFHPPRNKQFLIDCQQCVNGGEKEEGRNCCYNQQDDDYVDKWYDCRNWKYGLSFTFKYRSTKC